MRGRSSFILRLGFHDRGEGQHLVQSRARAAANRGRRRRAAAPRAGAPPWCGTPPPAKCRAGTRRSRAPGSLRSRGASHAERVEERRGRCASESNSATGTPRWFESSRLTSSRGEALGDRDQVQPAHAARERAQQRRHRDAEPERVLAGLDAAIEVHEPREHLESERAAQHADASQLRAHFAQRLRRARPGHAALARAGTGPAGRNRSAATASTAAISSSSAQRRGRNGVGGRGHADSRRVPSAYARAPSARPRARLGRCSRAR